MSGIPEPMNISDPAARRAFQDAIDMCNGASVEITGIESIADPELKRVMSAIREGGGIPGTHNIKDPESRRIVEAIIDEI